MEIDDLTTPKAPRWLKWAFIALGIALLLISTSWIGSYLTVTKDGKVFDLIAPAYTTNSRMERQDVFKPGDGLIINYPVERHPRRCWAMYVDLLDGPVSYQFNDRRSQNFKAKSFKITIRNYQVLPNHLPAGRYQIVQLVYPSCDGYVMQPYRMDTGHFITIQPE